MSAAAVSSEHNEDKSFASKIGSACNMDLACGLPTLQSISTPAAAPRQRMMQLGNDCW